MMDIDFINKFLKSTYDNLIKNIKGILRKHYIEILVIGLFIGLPYIINQDLKVKMFEYAGDRSNSIVVILIWLLCLAVSFIFAIFSFKIFHKWDKIGYRVYCFVFFIILFIFYLMMAKHCAYPICLFNPLTFVPVLIIFMLIIRGTKCFYLYLMLFLLPFISFIVLDKVITYHFLATCESQTPKAEFNPIYLPNEFFHEEIDEGKNKLMLNYRYINNSLELERILRDKNANNYVYIYKECTESNNIGKFTTIVSHIEKNIIILCIDEKLSLSKKIFPFNNVSFVYKKYNILDKHLTESTIANIQRISISNSLPYISGRTSYCIYNHQKYPKNAEFIYGHFKDDEDNVERFIKPLSNR